MERHLPEEAYSWRDEAQIRTPGVAGARHHVFVPLVLVFVHRVSCEASKSMLCSYGFRAGVQGS